MLQYIYISHAPNNVDFREDGKLHHLWANT